MIHLKLEDISSAYSGKAGVCHCGCAGTYYYNSAHRVRAGKHRGYAVTDEDVNDRQVQRVLNIIKKCAVNMTGSVEIGPSYISVTVGKREYVVYPERWLNV